MKTCSEIMTANPTCCLLTDAVTKAAVIMKNEGVGAVPVVDDHTSKKLVGIITDRDIVVNLVAAGKGADARVEHVMTRNPVTCRPDDAIQHAMDRMSQHQVRRIPVIDGRDRVVGIIAQADLAVRVDQPQKTGAVVEDISQPVG